MKRSVMIVFFLLAAVSAYAATPEPTVKNLTGSASVDGKPLKPGATVAWNSTVEVAQGAQLALAAGSDWSLRLNGPAKAVIDAPLQTSRIRLLFGRAMAAFRKGLKATLGTRTVIAGIRGTVVYFEQEDQTDDGYFCVCEGEVRIGHESGETKVVKSTHHDEPLDTGKGRMKDAPMKNHTDKDVEAVKSLLK